MCSSDLFPSHDNRCGDSVRAAVKCGFMVEPKWTLEDVDNAKPAHIVWLADCIAKLISEAMNLDPLS